MHVLKGKLRKVAALALAFAALGVVPVANALDPDSGAGSYEPYLDDDPGVAGNVVSSTDTTVLNGDLDTVPENSVAVGDEFEMLTQGIYVNNTGGSPDNEENMTWTYEANGEALAFTTTPNIPGISPFQRLLVTKANSQVTAIAGDQVTLATEFEVVVSAVGSLDVDESQNTVTVSQTIDQTGGIDFDLKMRHSETGGSSLYYNPTSTRVRKEENLDLRLSGFNQSVAWEHDSSMLPANGTENEMMSYTVPAGSMDDTGGQEIHVRVWGLIQNDAVSAGTLTIRGKMNGTNLVSSGATAIPVNSAANVERFFVLDWYLRPDDDGAGPSDSINQEARITIGGEISAPTAGDPIIDKVVYRRGNLTDWNNSNLVLSVTSDWDGYASGQDVEFHGYRVDQNLTSPG